ncbi:2-hydroxy-3-oxopropionate reductase [Pedococcus aerophilus]|uniref:2-hydroxy-3-oxopropionate reductase n=1 Tax=Pedococcus aerophilus TaxID=436356 RepID=A0ABN3UMY2_9MICO
MPDLSEDEIPSPEAVAFVGLGRMGLPMSLNLARAGAEVRAWNRSPRTVDDAPAGWTLAPSIAEAVGGARVVVTMLPDLGDVVACLDSLLVEGQIVIVMGTVSPTAVTGWGAELAARGVDLVDAPVSGGTVGADEGSLSIMVGGEEGPVGRVLPVLATMGTARHLGQLGSGQLAKACNQVVVGVTLTALAEAVALGEAGGLDVGALLDVLAGGLAGSRALDVKRGLLESGDFTPGGRAAYQHKDLGFALAAARATGTTLPVTALVDQLYGAMVATGRGDDDHSGVVELTRLLSSPRPRPPEANRRG